MGNLRKEAAYIKGLFDGMKLAADKDETKLLSAIIAYLEKSAEAIDDLDDEQGFFADRIDDIEDFLDAVAEGALGPDDDDDDEYQVKCADCGEVITVSGDELDEIFEGDYSCPECGNVIKIDFDDADDDCGCGCGHSHD